MCSAECEKEHSRRQALQRANDNYEAPECNCAECGQDFVPAYGDKRRVYCSAECMRKSVKRAAKQARRARIKATEIEPVYTMVVLDRDGWKCVLCGIDTPRELRGTTHDQAPEMDHIIPLAKGGPHTYENVRCLCRKCNQAKSDRLDEAVA